MLCGDFAVDREEVLVTFDPAHAAYWDDAGAPYYSGVASYLFTLTLPSAVESVWLDLGDVHESAQVLVNGKLTATRGWAPYVLYVTAEWHQGANQVEVRVANTACNTYEKRRNRSGINGTLRYAV